MTSRDKKKRAAMIAVAYFLEQEQEQNSKTDTVNAWTATGKEIAMSNNAMVQRRGRLLRSRD